MIHGEVIELRNIAEWVADRTFLKNLIFDEFLLQRRNANLLENHKY